MKSVYVVAAVIYCPKGQQILIAKRPEHLHQGGLWEFPGGKLERDETPINALSRELKEELDIQLSEASQLLTIVHDYPDKSVFLDVWVVSAFTGEPNGMEGQEVRWVSISALPEYDFPAANRPILEKILQSSVLD